MKRELLVSLSHVNDPATTNIYPGDPPFELETVATIEKDGYYTRYVRQGEHTGTHWGAPGHFNEGEALADDLDLGDLFLPAVKIDVRDSCARDADYQVTIGDVEEWERHHGQIPAESMVIIWTGWDAKWGSPAYLNTDAGGALHHPGFALDTVRWLADTGRIGHRGGTGTDAFSPDPGIDTTYAVSRLVYQRHRISLEILANLAALPPTGAHILCGGHINRAGAGSTALIYGVLPPPEDTGTETKPPG
ncbi:kynurenine formamidase [Actinoplanes tereljensis]|uniref:Cyclase n=1 Tax=Paractinoplanes tereljensis TaxID=571912 RepID=A0A919TRV1_9ACTN|nr:cyclase family protein [Actinoplanes tereljensis]GIF20703.1 cyclase [Actinoplanes tereljensis]